MWTSLNSLLCANVPLRNYSLTHSLTATSSTAWQMSTWQFSTTLQDNTRRRRSLYTGDKVTSSLTCSSHVVQGEILPKIDDDVDCLLRLNYLHIICVSNICQLHIVTTLCDHHQLMNSSDMKFVLVILSSCLSVICLLVRDSIYAIARSLLTPVRPSVCLSVCPSLCLSHGWISQRRLQYPNHMIQW